MKVPSILRVAAGLLIGSAEVFSGQMAAEPYALSAQLGYGQTITITDYYTGSQYFAWLYGGFDNCVDKQCTVSHVLPCHGGAEEKRASQLKGKNIKLISEIACASQLRGTIISKQIVEN